MKGTEEENSVLLQLFNAYMQEEAEKMETDAEALKKSAELDCAYTSLAMELSEEQAQALRRYKYLRDNYQNEKIREAYEKGFKTAGKILFETLR